MKVGTRSTLRKKSTLGIAGGLLLCVLAIQAISVAFATPASAANGADFKAGNIIDDATFTNKGSMSIEAIQNFLNQKVPSCDTNGDKTIYDSSHGDTVTRRVFSERRGKAPPFTCLRDYNEGGKSAAQIIWEKSQDYTINPQVLIVLLQKEQALVTDDWPWPVQYRTATGYGCPDTAPCDEQYYGFTNQVQKAASMFRSIMNDTGFNNYPVGNNSILYNPNHSCGSSQVTVLNRATSALYTYTPYQPNASVLNNMYGLGDSCGAYGNRNFWRDFTDWFGPSSGEGFVLAKSTNPNDLRQWVIYYGIKQLVPNSDIVYAWGLEDVPLVTYSDSTLNSIPTGPTLGRLMKSRHNNAQYLVDKGKKYAVTSLEMLKAWNLDHAVLSTVSVSLFDLPTHGGSLTYSVRKEGTGGIYMVSGTSGNNVALRAYPSPEIFTAWEGDNPKHNVVSADLFNQLDNAIGATLTGPKIIYNGQQYMVNNGKKLALTGATAGLYPGTAQNMPADTINRLPRNGAASPFVRVEGTSGVYLVDQGERHPVTSPYVLNAWGQNRAPLVNVVNSAYANLIPTDSQPINNFMAKSPGGQVYLLDGRKLPVPSHLHVAYDVGTAITISDAFLSTLSTGPNASLFIKAAGHPGVYMLENGVRRAFTNPTDFSLWTNSGNYYIQAADYVVNSFTQGSVMSSYISHGGTNYLIDGNSRHAVSAATASGMGLPAPAAVTADTLGRMPAGVALPSAEAKIGDSYYYFGGGTAWNTTSQDLASLWQLTDAPSVSSKLLAKVNKQAPLGRFLRSAQSNDPRVFTIDNGKIYHLGSTAMVRNLGYTNTAFVPVTDDFLNPKLQAGSWQLPLARDADGRYFVLDGGLKRAFVNIDAHVQWTNNGQLNVPVVSNRTLNMLGNGGLVGKSIKGSASSVYKVENGQKRWVLSPQTYSQQYAPFTQTSDWVVEALPSASSIP